MRVVLLSKTLYSRAHPLRYLYYKNLYRQQISVMSTTTKARPPWFKPVPAKDQPVLKLRNSLTRKTNEEKTEFIPQHGRRVTWYNCGPTVYDASHLGHARTYLTMDIIRRILEDYFNYDVLFVQNVTDVDDKIILRARQQYLFETFKEESTVLDKSLIDQVEQSWQTYTTKMLSDIGEDTSVIHNWSAFVASMTPDKVDAAVQKNEKFKMKFSAAQISYDALQKAKEPVASDASKTAAGLLLDASRDIVSEALDKKLGANVNAPEIFLKLPAYWEEKFYEDLAALNVRPPDIQTRVSEYVPEIIAYIEKIIENGYTYEVNGSVYFDTERYDGHNGHHYVKLNPNAKGNSELLEDGEGALSRKWDEKKRPSDFALWKASKSGEPAWSSPWGQGRPGWHIECSVMACAILGESMDIHSGGIDLQFPHHDNEIAQAEAYHNCDQWVNYFLHAGHLHVEGQKMSKSLKNFTTIQEALQKHTARQIRLLFLSNKWDAGLDFKESTMEEIKQKETTIKTFFSNIKAISYQIRTNGSRGATITKDGNLTHRYRDDEKKLLASLQATQDNVHKALCDSIDTPTAMDEIMRLISKTNIYLSGGVDVVNVHLVNKVARWTTTIFKVFGVAESGADIGFGSDSQANNVEGQLLPYLDALSKFRDETRKLAIEKKPHEEILASCDFLRDTTLVDLGVSLDDQANGTALVKLVPREELIKAREEKLAKTSAEAAEKAAKKAKAAAEAERKQQEKLEKAKVSHTEMFKTKEYSKFDENGIPTHTHDGTEVTKSQTKKLQKAWDAQKKLHEEYLKNHSS